MAPYQLRMLTMALPLHRLSPQEQERALARPWRAQVDAQTQTRVAAIAAAEQSADLLTALAMPSESKADPVQQLVELLQAQSQTLLAQHEEMARLSREVAALRLEIRGLRQEIQHGLPLA